MGLRWYVVQARPGDELLAVKHLTNQKFTTFLPLIRALRGKLVVKSPMFGTYFFVELDLEDARWRAVWGTRGVARMLGASPLQPSPLRAGIVESLLELQVASPLGVVLDFGPPLDGKLNHLDANAHVLIVEGPMAGYEGLVAIDQGTRVRVLLSLFGREREVVVDRKNLQEIHDRP